MSDREIQISSDYDQYEECALNETQPGTYWKGIEGHELDLLKFWMTLTWPWSCMFLQVSMKVRINIRLVNGPTNRNIEIEIGESKDEAFEGDHSVLEENDAMPSLPKMT